MTDLAIIGPGAIGGTLAAHLLDARPQSVLLCARTPFESLVVETPTQTQCSSPPLLTSPRSATPHPWVFLATKAHQTEGARPWLDALVDSRTTLVILQNGVEHLDRLPVLDSSPTMIPVVIDCPATATAPGRIRQRSSACLTIPRGPQSRDFADLFRKTDVEVVITEDFKSAAWKKLCLNVAGGAITALTRRPHEVFSHPDLLELGRRLIEECALVARAEGADLPWDYPARLTDQLRAAAPDSGSSMLADRLAGRPLEVDARNGAVVRIGRRHQIATPWNQMITALLHASEA